MSPALARKPVIGDDRRDPALGDPLEPGFRRPGDLGLESDPLQDLGDVFGELDLIVDDEDVSGLHGSRA